MRLLTPVIVRGRAMVRPTEQQENTPAPRWLRESRGLLERRATISTLVPVAARLNESINPGLLEHGNEISALMEERARANNVLMSHHHNLMAQAESISMCAAAAESEEIVGLTGVEPANAAANVWLIAREQGITPVVADAAEQHRLLECLQELRIKELLRQTRRRVSQELVLRSGDDWSADVETVRLMARDDADNAVPATANDECSHANF